MLEIKNLSVGIENRQIIKSLNLDVKAGEVHAIMGPNGSGKSTLASTLAGKEDYKVSGGAIIFNGENLLEKSADERARDGVFLAFQYPVEIPGVSMANFMKAAINEQRKHRNEKPVVAKDFLKAVREKMAMLSMDKAFLNRSLNEGFSGGEKKRSEIFQMAMLKPQLAIMDETDSGLDIDALKIVSEGINHLRNKENAFIVITHYQRLLNYIVPDYVHVLFDGKIVKSGGKELAMELEEKGYDWLQPAVTKA